MRRSPWEAVKVAERAPPWRAPCSVPAAPASLWSSTTAGTLPKMFRRPLAAHSSQCSAIGEAGVIGKMAHTSFRR